MASFRAWVVFVGIVSLTSVWPPTARANDSLELYNQLTHDLAAQSSDRWTRGSISSSAAGRNLAVNYGEGTRKSAEEQQAALREYLVNLVREMKPSPVVAHIPDEHPVQVDVKNPAKRWTKYYAEAKNSLRPHVEYKWNSNAGQYRALVTLTEEHIETLRDNIDILMWYRNELDAKATGDNHLGAKRFKLFLDYFVADLLEGLPAAPKVDLKTGKVAVAEWQLDEQNLREQLIMAYRYLVAKHQVYEEFDQFGPADRELLVSMMKIAFLVGAHMNPNWFQEMDVNLKEVTKKTKWKRPITDALEVLNEGDTRPSDYELPCVIAIPPPKPKPKPAAPKAPDPLDEQKLEIIIRPKR